MARKKSKSSGDGAGHATRKPMSLKKLAEHLDLSPATVSLVINRSSVADSIPQDTKDRIFAAARKFKYRPNFFARSLRTQRSFTIGVIVPEVSDGYSASVMSGVEDYLLQEGFFYAGGESGCTKAFESRERPKQCYNCQEITDHKAHQCTKAQVCGRCAKEGHRHSECTESIPKCVPCGGPHESFSRNCRKLYPSQHE